jgi:hypothetical protein
MATLEAIYEALPGRLSSGNPAPTLNLEPLFESRLVSRAPLDELLTRMARRTLPRHRPDCVGASKELCEAFAKGYLGAVHEPFNNDDHLPRLAGRVCGVITERANDRGDVAPETLKRILGGVGGVVQGIAEVRNAVGTGHGRPERPQGLTSALSNLAAEASTVFCLFLARNFLEEGQQGIASGAGRSSSEKA